jgi:uncharacterized protein with PIN domain
LEREKFRQKLKSNGYSIIPKLPLRVTKRPQKHTTVEKVFYLSLPFISDSVDGQILKSLKPLGMNIRISHKGRFLKDALRCNRSMEPTNNVTCKLVNCSIKNNKLCFQTKVVYSMICHKCGGEYVGSTFRHLHTRVKEHLTMKTSSVFLHSSTCGGTWNVSVLARNDTVANMRMKEAIFIKDRKPQLNKKEDLLRLAIIV